jgi:hypothetical protein
MTTFTAPEQQAAYIAGLDAAVEDARLHLATVLHDPAAYTGALAKWRGLRVLAREARLNAYGVPCEPCEGHGYYNEVDRHSSDGLTTFDCGACGGTGRVMPEEATR